MTQNCPQCGTPNRDTARFCVGCSAPLAPALVCPSCGTANSATARFCQQCATPLQNGAVPFRPDTGLLSPQSMLSGRYIILHKVGQGGMAAVYQAADARITGKTWAVKEMSDAAITDLLEKQQAVEAFRREAELLSQLSHPNIPRVTDFFSEGGRQYLVMEFVDGETLEEKLAGRSKPFSESEVRPWAEQLCDVLDYLHSQRPPVIFRDLKPANVMVDRAGTVKLIDFGIVRFFQPGKAKDTVSFGTASYAPPEQYGKGQTDARSDIYALGATLHHLLTGCDPAPTPFQFESVCRLNPAVSPQMERMVMRAVEQEPARRWPSAKEMRQAMEAPTHPPPPPLPVPVKAVAPPPAPLPTTPAAPSLERASFWGYLFTVLIVGCVFGATSFLFLRFWRVGSLLLCASGPLGAIIAKRPGAALLTRSLTVLLVWLFWGGQVGLRECLIAGVGGLATELVFLLGGYRKFGWWAATIASLAGLVGGTSVIGIFYGFWHFEELALALPAGTVAFVIGKILKKC